MKKAIFFCNKCNSQFYFEGFLPEKIICLECETEYSAQDLLKIFRAYERDNFKGNE